MSSTYNNTYEWSALDLSEQRVICLRLAETNGMYCSRELSKLTSGHLFKTYEDLWSWHTIFSPVNDNPGEATYKLPLEVCHKEKHFGRPFDVRVNCG
jgi:hypothetical protein